MPRRARSIEGGLVYHILNRSNARMTLFEKDVRSDGLALLRRQFVQALLGGRRILPARHSKHFRGVWVGQIGQTGPLYQGRFKSFPIQEDDHLLTVLRYVERNPLRANLVDEADAWRWSSLWHRTHRNRAGLVDAGPVVLPRLFGDSTCKPLKPRRNWRRCVVRWCVVRLSATPIGSSAPRRS